MEIIYTSNNKEVVVFTKEFSVYVMGECYSIVISKEFQLAHNVKQGISFWWIEKQNHT